MPDETRIAIYARDGSVVYVTPACYDPQVHQRVDAPEPSPVHAETESEPENEFLSERFDDEEDED